MPRLRAIAIAVAALAAAALGASGCGYRPLYGDNSATGGPDVRGQLAQVKISGIADRRGQMVRNYLVDRMNPGGEPAQARYVLSVTLLETTRVTASRPDDTATRSDLLLVANYRLRDTASDVVVFTERAEAVATYNLLTNRFASVSSQDEARRRAAEQIADQIAMQVALFLNRRHAAPRADRPS